MNMHKNMIIPPISDERKKKCNMLVKNYTDSYKSYIVSFE
jgi:hypothetical protein